MFDTILNVSLFRLSPVVFQRFRPPPIAFYRGWQIYQDKIVQPPPISNGGQVQPTTLMNNAEAPPQRHHSHFAEAAIATQFSDVFYDSLPNTNLNIDQSSSILTSSSQLSQAVIRLVQMNRAGDKRTENFTEDEDSEKRRKIRRTQSHIMPEVIIDKRPQSVIIGPGGGTLPTSATISQTTTGRLFLGSSPVECNKNFMFSGVPTIQNENGLL